MNRTDRTAFLDCIRQVLRAPSEINSKTVERASRPFEAHKQNTYPTDQRKVDGRDARSTDQLPTGQIDDSLIRTVESEIQTGDLINHFIKQAEQAGFTVHCSSDEKKAIETIRSILTNTKAKQLALGMDENETKHLVQKYGVPTGCKIIDWKNTDGKENQFDMSVGLTDAIAGIAESGTVVVCSDAQHSRLAPILPPTHITILRSNQIVPDLIDVWTIIKKPKSANQQVMPTSLTFITGPSKTADIEGILITGVHGPGQIHIVLIG